MRTLPEPLFTRLKLSLIAWAGTQTDATRPVLMREDRTDGGDPQIIAEYIENLQFRYTLNDGSEKDFPNNPDTIEMISITVTARAERPDPKLSGDGYRRRSLTSTIKIRNLEAS